MGCEPRPPALYIQNLNHWTSTEVPRALPFVVVVVIFYSIFGCAGSSLLLELSLAVVSGDHSLLWCTSFSLW